MRRNISSRLKKMVRLTGFGLFALIAFAQIAFIQVAGAQNMPQSFADIVEDLMPTVVNISISKPISAGETS